MRRSLFALIAVALLAAGLATTFRAPDAGAQAPASGQQPPQPPPGGRPPGGPPTGDSAARAAMQHQPYEWDPLRADTTVAMMLDHIKGKEDMPAESVYKNIKILKGIPARRLPNIMVRNFSRSLGMRCSGCHVRNDFASDNIDNKRIARDMWAMVDDLNKNELTKMKDLDVQMPMVACWTCHRGHHEPETDPDHPAKTPEPPKPESTH